MLTTILLATDGSRDAALALRVASDLSEKTGAKLHLVYVWRTPAMIEPAPVPVWPFEEDARRILDAELKRVARGDTKKFEAHLEEGHPLEVILGLADELEADLIVMGSRGRGPLFRLALGSVSEGVLYRSVHPVLVVRGGEGAWPPRRIVIGEDGSEGARRAGELAAGIGGLFGAKTMLVQATEGMNKPHRLPEFEASVYEKLVEEAHRGSLKQLALRAARLSPKTGTWPETRLAQGDPASAILDAAEEDPATLVAVGARGLGGVRRALLGGVSTKVLRAANGPVLVYATPTKEETASEAHDHTDQGASK